MIDDQLIKTINSYLTFRLGDEYFAVHVGNVLNILEMMPITHVPKSHDSLVGVINLRGNVLSVVDIRQKFNVSQLNFTKHTCILVLRVLINDEPSDVGAIVDFVDNVIDVKPEEIQEPLTIGAKYKSEFVLGVIKFKEKFIQLIDIDKIYELRHYFEEEQDTTIAVEKIQAT